MANKDNKDHKIDLKSIFKEYGTKDGMTFKNALKYARHNGIATDTGILKINKYAMVGSIEVLKQSIIANGPCIGGLIVRDSSKDDFWNGYNIEGKQGE